MAVKEKYDYKQLVRSELNDMSNLLHTLTREDWEHPTLCEGWKVKHIVGHFVVGYSVPLPKILGTLVFKYRLNFPKAAHEVSTSYGEENSPEKLLADFDQWTKAKKHRGVATVGPMKEHYLDHLIHYWDITIPMGVTRPLSRDCKLAALDALVGIRGLTGIAPAKKFAMGRHLVATGVDWQWGEGFEIRGKTVDLVLALTGRMAALDRLEGPGLAGLHKDLLEK